MERFMIAIPVFAHALTAVGCGGEPIPLRPDAGLSDASPEVLRLAGVDPPSGPHLGGNRVVLEGVGFVEGATRVQVAEIAIEEDRITVVSPGRVSLVMPPHAPGSVPVTVQVGGTAATLEDAYLYQALAIDPAAASTDGGLRVSIRGHGGDFRAGDAFLFGGAACTELVIVSPDEARCRVPARDAPGHVDVVLQRDGSAVITASAAFEYVDAPFTTGSVSGAAIDRTLDVSVIGTSGPLPDALVLVTGSPAGELRGRTDASGKITFSAPSLRGPVSVHAGHVCYSRTSLIGVNARTVSIPLDLHSNQERLGCPRPSGGSLAGGVPDGRARALIQFTAGEFDAPTREWIGVPTPRPGTRRVLYVFTTLGMPAWRGFRRLLEADWDPSRQGFGLELGSAAGNGAVCAVAGIEPDTVPEPFDCEENDPEVCSERVNRFLEGWDEAERSRLFERFVVGCSPGVVVPPGGTSREVTVVMNGRLTETLTVRANPLPNLAIVNAESAVIALSELSPDVEVAAYDVSYLEGNWGSMVYRRSGSTPFTARFERFPARPFRMPGLEAYTIVKWAGGRSRAFVPFLDERMQEVTPLGVPRFVAPTALAGARTSDPIGFAIDGTERASLIAASIRPDGYVFGGTIPAWYVFAAGDAGELALPAAPEPELQLPSALYELTIEALAYERFDFNHWSFLDVARSLPRARSDNRIFARLNSGAP